jgi:HSP20 family protein
MSLIKWEPFDEFDRFFREVQPLAPNRQNAMGFDMAVDVYEDGKDIVAEMNVPGLKGEDIDVEVEDSYLRISGRREEVQEKKEKNHYAKEIRRGSFERVVQLPDAVEQELVSAEYKDGVLKVVMPKREKTADKKVKVQVR